MYYAAMYTAWQPEEEEVNKTSRNGRGEGTPRPSINANSFFSTQQDTGHVSWMLIQQKIVVVLKAAQSEIVKVRRH